MLSKWQKLFKPLKRTFHLDLLIVNMFFSYWLKSIKNSQAPYPQPLLKWLHINNLRKWSDLRITLFLPQILTWNDLKLILAQLIFFQWRMHIQYQHLYNRKFGFLTCIFLEQRKVLFIQLFHRIQPSDCVGEVF